MNNFSENGFVVLKEALSVDLIKEIHYEIAMVLNNNKKLLHEPETFIQNHFKYELNYYDELTPVFEHLLYKKILDKIVCSKKLYNEFVNILGKDLAFCCDPSLTVNIPKKASPKDNYLFKDWHQEIWSGASHRSIQIWTPLFHKSSSDGQMEIIPSSHLWGHIPHENRTPKRFAKNVKTLKTELEYGDVLIFSTLLLHRSIPTSSIRISLPLLIQNIRYDNNSFEKLRNFKIFSFSEITKIERRLGNHHLSPFRLEQSKTIDSN